MGKNVSGGGHGDRQVVATLGDSDEFEHQDDRPSRLFFIPLVMVIFLFSLGCFGIYWALQLQPPTESELWFQDGHMMNDVPDIIGNEFFGAKEDAYEEVWMIWGIEKVDNSE